VGQAVDSLPSKCEVLSSNFNTSTKRERKKKRRREGGKEGGREEERKTWERGEQVVKLAIGSSG
jgi:hypothetical protein